MHGDLGFLVLMLTERCNMSCAYCYARAGSTGRDMPYALAQQCVDDFVRSGKNGVVELTGGEPLLVFDALSELVRRNRGRPGLRFALQTNGLLLDQAKLDFFVENGVALGLSLDGPPNINDLTRAAGRKTLSALTLLDEADVGVNITVVVTNRNIDELPRFLLMLGGRPSVRVVNLDLLRRLGRAPGAGLSPTATQVENMAPKMLEALAFINSRRWPPLKVREVEQLKKRRHDDTPQPYCLACLGAYAAVTPRGEVYPCSSLIGDPAYRAGTLGSLDWGSMKNMVSDWALPAQCESCPSRFYCRGGCPARRIASTSSARNVSELECVLRRAIHREMGD